MASFFRPHHYYNVPEPNFQGLFRLIDDFDRYSNQASTGGSQGRQGRGGNVSFFTPKFDMTESESAYELHGELPGLAKEDVHIEFTDPQTLQIRGKVERTHTAGTPPAGLLGSKEEDTTTTTGAITDGSDDHAETSSVKSHSSHHATVEDDPEETGASTAASTSQSTPQDTPATTVVEAAKPSAPAESSSKPAAPRHKYYLVERNIGSFARSFNFPARVDNESVQASLKDGILTVVVQKAKKHESRRIAIN